ncbi:hypothetical protein, partial [uncultured Ruegeria sp.]|uniref:hypothetical protein n=1 Tax=uncultured Ruegeria sp. TaxID=259304 RepID=UPI00261D41D9
CRPSGSGVSSVHRFIGSSVHRFIGSEPSLRPDADSGTYRLNYPYILTPGLRPTIARGFTGHPISDSGSDGLTRSPLNPYDMRFGRHRVGVGDNRLTLYHNWNGTTFGTGSAKAALPIADGGSLPLEAQTKPLAGAHTYARINTSQLIARRTRRCRVPILFRHVGDTPHRSVSK